MNKEHYLKELWMCGHAQGLFAPHPHFCDIIILQDENKGPAYYREVCGIFLMEMAFMMENDIDFEEKNWFDRFWEALRK